MAASRVRIMAMIRCAIEQQAAATAALGFAPDVAAVTADLSRVQTRMLIGVQSVAYWL